MATIDIDGKSYQITGIAPDGLPIIKGEATSTVSGVDKEGNPIRNVTVNVPAIVVGLNPGKVS